VLLCTLITKVLAESFAVMPFSDVVDMPPIAVFGGYAG
jgi:hypothetical protein